MRFSQNLDDRSLLLQKDLENQSSYETFEQKKNLVIVEDKFTDFQKTFGFYESIEELKKQNEAKEKRRFYSYGLGALIGVGLVTGVLLIGIDPAIDKSLKRAYYVHTCNLKLKKPLKQINSFVFNKLEQNIINSRGSSIKKLQIIEEYFQKMKEINSKQPAYNLYLVEEIRAIIQRHSILNDQETIKKCIKWIQEIQIIMESSQRYNIYFDEYFKSIENIVSTLIQSKILIKDNYLENTCFFCFVKTNDMKQMNTFIAYLKLNGYNLKEQTPLVIEDMIQKSLQIINNCNSNDQEFQFKNVELAKDSSYVSPDDFLQFYDKYKKQYYCSTLYQISEILNQLSMSQKQKFAQEIRQINTFIQQNN